MNIFFILNFAIIVLIAVIVFVTNNPLAMLGLFFLQTMPYEPPEEGEETDATGPMGFIDTSDS